MRKTIAFSVCLLMLLSLFSFAGNVKAQGEGLYLYVGSPLTISNNQIKPLDSENLSLVPVISQGRTLVPLRAIAEHFGAEVSYDADARTAVIRYGGKTARFPVDQNAFTLDSQTYPLDTATTVVNGRCLVPLRAIAEIVLGKYVDYASRIIAITDAKIALAADAALMSAVKEKIGAAVKLSSTDELKALIASGSRYYYADAAKDESAAAGGFTANAPAPTEAPAASEEAQASGSGGDYSATNTQVEGIDEADIVKTDGKFIYAAYYDHVDIVRADGGALTAADAVKPAEGVSVSEIYIGDGRLVVLGTRYEAGGPILYADSADAKIAIYPYNPGKTFTYAGVYAIDESGKAALLKEIEVEGYLRSSRKNGDCVYLISDQYIYYGDGPGEITPYVRDTAVSDEAMPLDVGSVIAFPGRTYSSYMNVTAVDIADADAPSHTEAILGDGNQIYMNDHALYLAGYDYDYESGAAGTSIVKIGIDGLNFGYAASGKVDGYLLNQFSMDEYGGFFRIATTAWTGTGNENAVYVLDGDLNVTGALEGLAPGERIYSVRFMGDTAYVVTFRNIDPLFVIDLSASDPRVAGELELPGFSNYLHPLGDGLIMGIGYDTEQMFVRDRETGEYTVIGTRQGGMKFSLFDVSDPAEPREVSSYILGGAGSWSDIQYNHKALMFNDAAGIFAFDATLAESTDSGTTYTSGAVVMSWDASGFRVSGQIPQMAADGKDGTYYWYGGNRLCYIGGTLYYIQGSAIRAFDMATLKETGRIALF